MDHCYTYALYAVLTIDGKHEKTFADNKCELGNHLVVYVAAKSR